MIQEQIYQEIFNATHESIFIHEATSGKILDVNNTFLSMYGYSSKDEISDISLGDISTGVPPYTQEAAEEKIQKALNEGPQVFDWLARKKSGELFWVEVSLRCYHFDDKPRVLAVVRDINDRKLANAVTQQHVFWMKRAQDMAKLGWWEFDLNQGKIWASVEAQLIYGLESNEALITQIQKLPLPEFRPMLDEKLSNLIHHGEKYDVKFRIRRPDNNEILYVHSVAEYNTVENKVFGIIRNITEDILAEFSLKESQRRLTNLLENFHVMVYRRKCEPQWTMEFIGHGCYELTGYQSGEFIGNRSFDDLILDDYRARVLNEYKEKVDLKEIFRVEYPIITASGQKKWFWDQGNGIYSDSGEIIALEGFIMDITEQKKNQEELLDLNLQLKIAKDKAEESDNLKSAFLANMSHEIRTPMNGILGFAELLQNPDNSREKTELFIQVINSCSHQLLALINDIIDISKIEASQITITNTKVDINRVLYEVNSLIQVPKDKNIDIICPHIKDISTVNIFIDEVRLKQILINLINNALKFTNQGFIEYGYQLNQSNILFFVRDTGIGIAPENQHLIFERFRQIDTSSTTLRGGTGLGLAITKALVEKMGGSIWVDSTIGKGSVFYFQFPLKPDIGKDKIVKEKAFFKRSQPDWEHQTVLIAEDEDYNYLYLAELLEPYKLNIIRVRTGVEAIDACKQNKIDLVLMDIKMPIMNGYEASRQLKILFPNLPIIAQTAYAMSDDREKAKAAGCDQYIPKPIKRDILIELMNIYLI